MRKIPIYDELDSILGPHLTSSPIKATPQLQPHFEKCCLPNCKVKATGSNEYNILRTLVQTSVQTFRFERTLRVMFCFHLRGLFI